MGAEDDLTEKEIFLRQFRNFKPGSVVQESKDEKVKPVPIELQEIKIVTDTEDDEGEGKKDKKREKNERRKGKKINPEIASLEKEFSAISQTVGPVETGENKVSESAGDNNQVIDGKEMEITEQVNKMDVAYQSSRLHYLGHRQNLIQEGKKGLPAIDKEDYIVGKLRLVEDLLRVTGSEGDLREVKDRLISVGVYVKDIKNLSEEIKPLHEERQRLLQKFYEDGSREDLEKLEKEIENIFGVDEIMERIKNGQRAQQRKESIKEEVKGSPKDLDKIEEAKKNEAELVNYMNKSFFDDLLMVSWGNWKKEETDQENANQRLQSVGVNLDEIYKKSEANEKEIRMALINYMDHKNGDKKQNEPLLRALKREILLKLGLDVKLLDSQPKVDIDLNQNGSRGEIYFNSDDLYKDLLLLFSSIELGERSLLVKKLEGNGVKIIDNISISDNAFLRIALEDIRDGNYKRWDKNPEKAKNFVKKFLIQEEFNSEEKTEKVEPVEDEEREKYLEYLGGEFLNDLKVIYAKSPKTESEIKKLRETRGIILNKWSKEKWTFQRIRTKDDKGIDFNSGRIMVAEIDNFLSMKDGVPENWEKTKTLLETSKIKVEDLEEARRLSQGKGEKEKGKSEMDKKEEMAALAREDLAGESLNKFYRAIHVIVSNNATGSEFKSVDEAREFFSLNIKVGLKTEGVLETAEDKNSKEDNKESVFVLTPEIRQKIKDWADITRKSRRPNLPNGDENLRELTDLGFEVDRADLQRVLDSVESIRRGKDDDGTAVRYLTSLFVGGGGEPKEPGKPKNTETEKLEENEEVEKEKWKKVADLLEKLGSTTKEDRKALYLEIESHGVRIRGTVSDLIDAGASEEDIKNSFRHMANMAKVWKMGEEKARREYPKMVEKYASMARLLRLKWYN